MSNDDQVKLSFQVRLVRWTQDAAGADQYEDSRDLIYFPRVMIVEPQQKRVIRVGTQGAPGAAEGTYRLIIEEMAPPAGAEGKRTAVAVRVRFAVPVFVAPAEPVVTPGFENLQVGGGEIRFDLRNRGNSHLKAETITLRRGGRVLAEVAGWYVLAGARRGVTLPLPSERCAGPAELVVKGEKVDLKRELVLDASHCGP